MSKVPFLSCCKGSVAFSFGLTLLPICLAVGVALDYGRVELVRNATQNALDTSLLAAAAENNTHSTEHLEAYFKENSASINAEFSDFEMKTDASGEHSANVKVSVPMSFMRLAGFKTMDFDLTAKAVSEAQKKLTEVTFQTDFAKGNYDKDIYFVTRDREGKILTRDLVLQYDFSASKGVTYKPAMSNSITLKVQEYESWAVEMVVYVDDSGRGKKVNRVVHLSDDDDASSWQIVDSDCEDPAGQRQSWEDLGDMDFGDFRFTLRCKTETTTAGNVRLTK